MNAILGRSAVGAFLALWVLTWCPALGQTQLPAQAQTPGQGTPQVPAQAQAPANPPDAPVPAPPPFPPPNLPNTEAKPTSQPALPNPDILLMMVRSTLMAFSQANLTNNYSVLLALAAPAFQKENDVARLGEKFASFRERKIDVSPVAVLTPRLFRPAEIDSQGLLRIAGVFPSQPLQVRFNIAYQSVRGVWRFAGLAVDVRPPEAQAQPATDQPAAVKPAPAAAAVGETRHHGVTRKRGARRYHPGRRGEPPWSNRYH